EEKSGPLRRSLLEPLVFSVGAGIQAENPVDFDHECPGRQVGLTLAYLAGGNGPGKGVVFISEKAGPKSLLRYTVVVSNLRDALAGGVRPHEVPFRDTDHLGSRSRDFLPRGARNDGGAVRSIAASRAAGIGARRAAEDTVV